MKKIACLGLFCLISIIMQGQGFDERIYQAFITPDLDLWEQSLKKDAAPNAGPGVLFDYAMAHFGFIGYCLGHDMKKRAAPYLDQAEVLADTLVKMDSGNAKVHALRGALHGYRMIYHPYQMMSLGPKSMKSIKLAEELDPDRPQVLVESANMDWSMPEIFGGSKVRAIAKYEKAIFILEKDPGKLNLNWYYLNANVILASRYEATGRIFAAREIYRKLIEFEPLFNFHKEKLLKR